MLKALAFYIRVIAFVLKTEKLHTSDVIWYMYIVWAVLHICHVCELNTFATFETSNVPFVKRYFMVLILMKCY